MRIDCDSCGAVYAIDDSLISERGVRAQCPRCGHQKVVRKNEGFSAAPAAPSPAPAPLPPSRPFAFNPSGANPAEPFASAPPAPAPSMADPFTSGPPAPAPKADPFLSAPPAPAPLQDPFASGAPSPAPMQDPFASRAPTQDPFASGAPSPAPMQDPFASGAPSPAPAQDPFASGAPSPAPTQDPFASGAPSPAPTQDPFASGAPSPAPTQDPFASGPPSAAPMQNPFAQGQANPVFGGDPFSSNPPSPAPNSGPLPFSAPGDASVQNVGQDMGAAGFSGEQQEGGSLWRIRKADGTELGPFETAEVKERIRAGEIDANDQIALGQDVFVAIADKQVFRAALGQEAGSEPDEAEGKGKKKGPKKKAKSSPRIRRASVRQRSNAPLITVISLLLFIGGGAFVVLSHPEWLPDMSGSEFANPLLNQINLWRLQYPDIEGTSAEHLSKGRKYYLDDSESSYRLANDELRKALLIDPDNIAAIGAYVENLSRLPDVKRRTEDVSNAFKVIDYAITLDTKRAMLQRARGSLLMALGSIQKAQSAFYMALRLNPNDAETLLLLAESDLGRNNAQSIERAEKAHSLDATLSRIDLIIGKARQGEGQFKKAYVHFQKRLQRDSEHIETLLAVAQLYVELGQLKNAVKTLQKIITLDDGNTSARLLLGKVAYQGLGDLRMADLQLTLATEDFAQSDELSQDQLSALVHLAHVRARRKDWNAAEKYARYVIKLDAAFLPAYYALGRIQEHNQDFAQAINSYQRVIQAMQGRYLEVEVRLALGVAQLALAKNDQAARDFEQIVEENPNQIRAYLGIAAAYAKNGDSANLAMAMRKVLDVEPNYERDHFIFSDYPNYAGDTQIFLKALEGFSATEGDASIRLSSLGIAAYQMNNMGNALNYLNKALEEDKKNLGALMYQGAAELRQGQAGAALKSLEKATQVNRLHLVTHYLLGLAQFNSGKTETARTTLKDVINDDSSFLPALCTLGEIERGKGNLDAARDHFLSAYKISIDMLPAKQGLFAVGY